MQWSRVGHGNGFEKSKSNENNAAVARRWVIKFAISAFRLFHEKQTQKIKHKQVP